MSSPAVASLFRDSTPTERLSAAMAIEPTTTGYADVNGLHLYHEVYGTGTPLVLLHGGMMTIELSFAGLIPDLAERHQVIGVELQGHGRTADIDRPITPAALTSAWTGPTSSATAWGRARRWSWR
jgi:pimeloyl-ACP methyl ester carboxylesterase